MLMGLIILTIMLVTGIVSLGIRLAWGTTKFVFGLGLFCLCPVFFLVAVLLGGFSGIWLPILIVGLLCGRGFIRA